MTKKATSTSSAKGTSTRILALRRFMIAGIGSFVLAALMVVAGHTIFRDPAGDPEAALHQLWVAIQTHDTSTVDKLLDSTALTKSVVEALIDMDKQTATDRSIYTPHILHLIAPELEIALHAQMESFIQTGQFLPGIANQPSFLQRLWQEIDDKPHAVQDVTISGGHDKKTTATLHIQLTDVETPLSLVLGLTHGAENWRVTSVENLRPFMDSFHRALMQRAEDANIPIQEALAAHLSFEAPKLLTPDTAADTSYSMRSIVSNTGEQAIASFRANLALISPDGKNLYTTTIQHKGTPLIPGNAVDKVWPLGLSTSAQLPASVSVVITPTHLTFDNGTVLELYTPNDF